MESINTKILEDANISPMMRQYLDTVNMYKDCIIFFRVGDFYETFFEQAKLVSKALNLALTGKECGMEEKAPMCGVPYHAVDIWLSKLVKLGYKVAIAEQMEDPKQAKGLVKREVTKVITPGTVLANEYLDDKTNNFIMSIYFLGNEYGVALLDFSTGDFIISDLKDTTSIEDIFIKYEPKELLVNSKIDSSNLDLNDLRERYRLAVTIIGDEVYNLDSLKKKDSEKLYKLLKTLDNYKDISENNSVFASIAAYNYVKINEKQELSHIERIKYLDDSKYMYLDASTIRNLELIEGIRNKDKKGTLLNVLDKTMTAMGGRLLYRFIEEPLIDKNLILFRIKRILKFYL